MGIDIILYIVDMLDSVGTALILILILSSLIATLGVLALDVGSDPNDAEVLKKCVSKAKCYVGLWFLTLLVCVLIPSEKTTYLMLGTNALKNEVKNGNY